MWKLEKTKEEGSCRPRSKENVSQDCCKVAWTTARTDPNNMHKCIPYLFKIIKINTAAIQKPFKV